MNDEEKYYQSLLASYGEWIENIEYGALFDITEMTYLRNLFFKALYTKDFDLLAKINDDFSFGVVVFRKFREKSKVESVDPELLRQITIISTDLSYIRTFVLYMEMIDIVSAVNLLQNGKVVLSTILFQSRAKEFIYFSDLKNDDLLIGLSEEKIKGSLRALEGLGCVKIQSILGDDIKITITPHGVNYFVHVTRDL